MGHSAKQGWAGQAGVASGVGSPLLPLGLAFPCFVAGIVLCLCVCLF